jgi:hypothetical protein
VHMSEKGKWIAVETISQRGSGYKGK